MKRIRRSRNQQDVDLDITAFMNLMIVLVPVLLLGMVFSQITVLDLTLPDAVTSESPSDDDTPKRIELLIRDDALIVNYPEGIQLKRIPKIIAAVEEGEETVETDVLVHDFKLLSLVLQEMKRQLREKSIENKAITILSEPNTSYQSIVSAMDTVRSYKAIVAASVVDAELFPEVSFGDAPIVTGGAVQ